MSWVDDLINDIEKEIEDMVASQSEAMAKQLSAAFTAGYKAPVPGSTAPVLAELQLQTIKKLSAENMGYLDEYNSALSNQLTAQVKILVAEGKGYEETKAAMIPYITETFGSTGTVEIDRVGQTKTVIEIGEDGTLRRVEKTTIQPYSSSIEAYTEMLSRTTVHQAYAKGRAEGYKAIGLSKWRYSATPDERVRNSHILLHGRVFEYGSDESELAEEVLQEPNCRCRQIPFFDDPRLDTNQDVYDAQKKKVEDLKQP